LHPGSGYAGSESGPAGTGTSTKTRWSRDEIDAQVGLCGDKPTEALVQRVELTDDAGVTYAALAEEWGRPRPA